jgi:hypothetical protein
MKQLTAVFFALCMTLSLTACENDRDRRSNQPGEAIKEGTHDTKRGLEDATEDKDNAVSEGASDVKRSAEDAAD